ncbi:MAG: hypothetical protein K2H41_00550 [Acetatifactor sp.]|nr:hypothetical protein [Acetatifactor sp.]MDE7114201.1 hypothetical protein [Acetatifactor sp.]
MEDKLKRKKLFAIIKSVLLILLVVWSLGTFFYLMLQDVIPVTRTHFWNYKIFNMWTDFTAYPKELPESAHNIKYYYYEGFLADKNGYRVSYSQEDYEVMKANRLSVYDTNYPKYCYDGGAKIYLDREYMKQRRIDFFDKLLPEEQDDGQYYFLVDSLYEDQELYSYACVLCNDETCEMIEISYHGPN